MPKTRSVPLAQHVWYRFAESVPHSREVEPAPRRGTLTAVEPELRGVGWIVFLTGFFVGMTPVRCRCGATASTTTTSRPPPPRPRSRRDPHRPQHPDRAPKLRNSDQDPAMEPTIARTRRKPIAPQETS